MSHNRGVECGVSRWWGVTMWKQVPWLIWSWRTVCQKVWDKNRDILCNLIVMCLEGLPVVWTWPPQVTGSVDGVNQKTSKTKGILGRVPGRVGNGTDAVVPPPTEALAVSEACLCACHSLLLTQRAETAACWKTWRTAGVTHKYEYAVSYFHSGFHPARASNK